MANREHVEILRNGALEWNAWRQEHPRIRPDLRGAHLAEAKLRRCDLRGADLRGASLLAANLGRADLRGADLSDCDLRFCTWTRARLSGAKLRDAKGATERVMEAAERIEWRDRLATIRVTRAGAAVASLAAIWALAEYGLPEEARLAGAPVLELAAAVSESDSAGWAVEGVAISGGLMRIRLAADELTEQGYVETLATACRALDARTLAPPVERIEILRRDGEAGWLFEPALRCSQVVGAPPERIALTVAASSLPIWPKPSPAAALRGGR